MDKLKSWFGGKLTRENMIVLALSGILLMVIALPSGRKEKEGNEGGSGLSDAQSARIEENEGESGGEERELERRLEEFLSCMEGAGEVKVMLTFSSTQEQVVEKDGPYTSSQTSENDSAGGSRSIDQREQEQSTVYTTDREGNQVPYVKKTLAAAVEGVTVLAQGGDSWAVKKNITDVIEALFGIEAHKIKVAKLVVPSDEAAATEENEESRGIRN